MHDITRVLNSMEQGDPQAAERLLPLVYEELRKLAAQKMAQEAPGQTLEATALVHEAYVRVAGGDVKQPWNGRAHFFGAAAEAMRRILIDNARRKHAARHGGGMHRHHIMELELAINSTSEDVLAVDAALTKLAQIKPEIAKVVELRFFAGLTLEAIATDMGIGLRTAHRHWAYARAWLRRELDEKGDD
jgi:RNA polymerase sigma factor (TIGR02999 family)